jgi:hypothetical protein
MEKYTWTNFVIAVVLSTIALHTGITTKVGPKNPRDLRYTLRSYTKSGGLILGIGGWIGAIHLLIILLQSKR